MHLNELFFCENGQFFCLKLSCATVTTVMRCLLLSVLGQSYA